MSCQNCINRDIYNGYLCKHFYEALLKAERIIKESVVFMKMIYGVTFFSKPPTRNSLSVSSKLSSLLFLFLRGCRNRCKGTRDMNRRGEFRDEVLLAVQSKDYTLVRGHMVNVRGRCRVVVEAPPVECLNAMTTADRGDVMRSTSEYSLTVARKHAHLHSFIH